MYEYLHFNTYIFWEFTCAIRLVCASCVLLHEKLLYIILPGIMPAFVVIFIISVANIINIGFEKQELHQRNPS